MMGSISTHSLFTYIISYFTILYYYTDPMIKSTRETGVYSIYHDRPGPCIARPLDPDRHVVVVDLLLLPVELHLRQISSRSVMHSILYSL